MIAHGAELNLVSDFLQEIVDHRALPAQALLGAGFRGHDRRRLIYALR
jgi:hypothetical protein